MLFQLIHKFSLYLPPFFLPLFSSFVLRLLFFFVSAFALLLSVSPQLFPMLWPLYLLLSNVEQGRVECRLCSVSLILPCLCFGSIIRNPLIGCNCLRLACSLLTVSCIHCYGIWTRSIPPHLTFHKNVAPVDGPWTCSSLRLNHVVHTISVFYVFVIRGPYQYPKSYG